MELKLINAKGKAAGSLNASDVLFGRDFNEALAHQIVTAYRANGRSGNRKQKDRSEVRHTTAKPWKQKGTGRARAGSNASPLWRGGGQTFPNSPIENFSQKINRKMYRAGMATILSELNRQERLIVTEELKVDAPKTKLFNQKIQEMGLEPFLLVITDNLDENLYLASRNLPTVQVLAAHEVDPYSLVRFPKVLATKAAIAELEEVWG